ncbi:hypothetical protein [Enterococcus faecium]|nr:hypothetical protein [Enterococcus faecium]SMH91346.1 Uncharacterised protein [Enterococcus faecium]SMI15413.1 Uncharacterised protein [Enterococcus faecium]SMJ21461.1 Uncharacterised protein [Enterococcus faecium]SMJ38652.1 Uncharacterised protein [Enterococcus faecium]
MEKEILIKSPGKTLIKVTDDSISIIRKGCDVRMISWTRFGRI